MRITQGTFSFLPDFTDEQIEAQLRYSLRNGWAIMIEHTDDPHPRNALWEMWGQPLFELAEDEVGVELGEDRLDPLVAHGCFDLGGAHRGAPLVVEWPLAA